jgi:hypothetical protein
MFEGKILHKVLENANKTGLIEKRFFSKVGGRTISAQIDTLSWDGEAYDTLSDWKRCPAFKLGKVDADWTSQLNTQCLLLEDNGIKVKNLQIIAFAKDHSKVMAATSKSYPKSAIERIPIEKWPRDKTIAFIEERIALHEAALVELPECTDNERYKRFNKGFKGVVAIKCLLYCDVSKFCTQYQKEQTNEV